MCITTKPRPGERCRYHACRLEGNTITTLDEQESETPIDAEAPGGALRLLAWLIVPGVLYLMNKFVIVYRDSFSLPPSADTIFGTCVPIWIIFGGIWILWILKSNETATMKTCIVVPILAVFYAAATLNYNAATGSTTGLLHFP